MNIVRMATPGKRGVPPRVHCIESLSRNFKNSVMKLAQDATEVQLQTTNLGVGDSNANNGAGGTANGNKNDEEDNLVIMRLCSQVIPLPITNSTTPLQWRKNIDAGQVEMQLQSIERMGVRTRPFLESIPILHYITPILHITIGKGHDILTSFIEEMPTAAE
jgi:hypothetical protein